LEKVVNTRRAAEIGRRLGRAEALRRPSGGICV